MIATRAPPSCMTDLTSTTNSASIVLTADPAKPKLSIPTGSPAEQHPGPGSVYYPPSDRIIQQLLTPRLPRIIALNSIIFCSFYRAYWSCVPTTNPDSSTSASERTLFSTKVTPTVIGKWSRLGCGPRQPALRPLIPPCPTFRFGVQRPSFSKFSFSPRSTPRGRRNSQTPLSEEGCHERIVDNYRPTNRINRIASSHRRF